MTPLAREIAEVLKLDSKRTPGEWTGRQSGNGRVYIHAAIYDRPNDPVPRAIAATFAYADQDDNAAFIAAAPRMARIIRELQAEVERLGKDAERFQIMADGKADWPFHDEGGMVCIIVGGNLYKGMNLRHALDAVIAAMSEQRGGG